MEPVTLPPHTGAVVLVEGASDRNAVETVAARLGRDLAAEGVRVVAMGGATNIRHYLGELAARPGLAVAGLYDAAEEPYFRRAAEAAGLGPAPTREALAALGFHACVADLEDEMIRALGTPAVLDVVAAEGELARFRKLQNQPAHRGRPAAEQLHRFLGTTAGRKERYGRLLADAVDLARIPAPLTSLLDALPAARGAARIERG
ncbi:TOPRIM nucleotidyl transferase/hydrolase domain-containing protein [Myceligenerans crystallogenes]|uniref:OLD protein-like TOPRIM domain-containing protein n=1 Tax=Myceligenerans crystallogenes TaxID=316335 RepID=A0ABN2N7Z6_9MICO